MIKKVLGVFILMLVAVIIFLFFKIGAYKSVAVEKTSPPILQLFYTEVIGPYHTIIEPLKKVEAEFKSLGHPCKMTFGHYLSDPETVEHDKLISHVGCAFKPEESPQLFTLPDGVQEKFFNTEGRHNDVCYKGIFEGSPSIVAMKVYPKLKEAAQKDRVRLNQDSALEVYFVEENKVRTEVYLCGSGA